MNEKEDHDMQVARFGIEVETFFNGQVGRFIFDMAEKQRTKAVQDFKDTPVYDLEEIRQIQNRLRAPDQIIEWLQGAIEEAHAAIARIQEQDAGEV